MHTSRDAAIPRNTPCTPCTLCTPCTPQGMQQEQARGPGLPTGRHQHNAQQAAALILGCLVVLVQSWTPHPHRQRRTAVPNPRKVQSKAQSEGKWHKLPARHATHPCGTQLKAEGTLPLLLGLKASIRSLASLRVTCWM